jgi:hypothetical protein
MTWTTDNRWNTGSLQVPEDALAAYGARWIDHGTAVDIVPDRQGFAYNRDEDREALIERLHRHDVRGRATDMLRDVVVKPICQDGFHVLIRRAGGYVYVAAWLAPTP